MTMGRTCGREATADDVAFSRGRATSGRLEAPDGR